MLLAATGLACRRGGRTVFTDLSFSAGAGEALTILGPNGAGKSSLLRLVAGLLRPAAGRIELADGDSDLTLAEQAHFVGHLDALKPALTAAENLAFWTACLGGRREDTLAALETVGLGPMATLPAGYLSAGQRRRLSLARLVAVRRPIWLLDEPASALDAASVEMLGRIMRDHLAGGGLILAATHGPLGLDAPRELHLPAAPQAEADNATEAGIA